MPLWGRSADVTEASLPSIDIFEDGQRFEPLVLSLVSKLTTCTAKLFEVEMPKPDSELDLETDQVWQPLHVEMLGWLVVCECL